MFRFCLESNTPARDLHVAVARIDEHQFTQITVLDEQVPLAMMNQITSIAPTDLLFVMAAALPPPLPPRQLDSSPPLRVRLRRAPIIAKADEVILDCPWTEALTPLYS